jgi:hypothetical protein
MVLLQVNDAAVITGLVIFGSNVHVQLFYTQISEQIGGGRGEIRGMPPSDLLCWLTVIWSGAPTDFLGEVPTVGYNDFHNWIGSTSKKVVKK